ncbi:MAG: SDR family oxidoreductase [Calditrichales bacterium]|nr:SDR family oxidoreductase [Calditrichales bacterium]
MKSKFESIKVGDKAEITHVITQRDVDKFVDLSGDDNKLHVDKEYASKTTFKKPVVHGMLGAAFISALIGTKLPGDGALWFAQNFEFLLPARVGDSITVKAEVVKKVERIQTIELSTEIYNQHKQKITTGTAKVKLIEQENLAPEGKKEGLTKKVALVLGGTGGIGKATCLQLAKDGFDVAVHYQKNKELAEKVRDRIIALGEKAIIVNADINDFVLVKEMVEKTIRKFNTITVVVNCTTLNVQNIKFKDLEWESIQNHFDINIKGSFNILKCVVPVMEKNKYGKVINLSTLAVEKPNSEWLHYITAKSALSGFTRAIAFELAPKGIRINLVSPGMTDTELLANIPEKVKLLSAAQTPLRTIAKPEDVAGAISYLASEKSDYLTGETIRVNGGQIMI